MVERGRGKKRISPQDIRATLRRLEGILVTKPFFDTLQSMVDEPSLVEEAKRNPKSFLRGRGVDIPDEAEAFLMEGSPYVVGACLFHVCAGYSSEFATVFYVD